MNNVFLHEVVFASKIWDAALDNFTYVQVKKTVAFKELCTTDEKQHRLHFKISAMLIAKMKEDGDDPDKVDMEKVGKLFGKIDSDELYDITVRFFKDMSVICDKVAEGQVQQYPPFSAMDRNEFVQDSGAILKFGLWLIGAKILPFFPTLLVVSKE